MNSFIPENYDTEFFFLNKFCECFHPRNVGPEFIFYFLLNIDPVNAFIPENYNSVSFLFCSIEHNPCECAKLSSY